MSVATTEPRLTKKQAKAQERLDAIAKLRGMLKEGDTVWIVLKKVSGSGMYRHISPMIVHKGEIVNVSGLASTVLEWRWHDDGSIGVSGCGMDMGFHLVYTLSRILFATDRIGEQRDPGYALKHRQL